MGDSKLFLLPFVKLLFCVSFHSITQGTKRKGKWNQNWVLLYNSLFFFTLLSVFIHVQTFDSVSHVRIFGLGLYYYKYSTVLLSCPIIFPGKSAYHCNCFWGTVGPPPPSRSVVKGPVLRFTETPLWKAVSRTPIQWKELQSLCVLSKKSCLSSSC
jgi:hypothetical protein